MNRIKNRPDVSAKILNMKTTMESLFTANEIKSISSILRDFKINRSIQYLVDNIQPYIDTKVKLVFIRCLYEIIPQSHQERFTNYCISKGLIVNQSGSDLFELKKQSTSSRVYNWNSYFDYDQEENELIDLFDMKSLNSPKNDEIQMRRKNSNNWSSIGFLNRSDKTPDNFNSRHLFLCKLLRLSSQHCNKYERSLQIWGIGLWRSRSTCSVYITEIDEVDLYKRNDIFERDIRIGQRLKLINNKEVSKMKDEEFLDILNNSMIIDLVLQGKGISNEDIWENDGGEYKWVDCINDRTCHPPLNFTNSLDNSCLKPIEIIKDVTQDLGINISGGKEYSLGIYVSSIKNGSIGSIIGFQTGDKILQINALLFTGLNTPFRTDALNIIHQCGNADIWIYSMHKLPITVTIPGVRSRSLGNSGRSEMYSVLESKGMFHKGQRNQLTHTSLTQPSLESLESQLSEFISKQDVNKILFLLEKYSIMELNIHQLVNAIHYNMHGPWNTKLINLIANALRKNDRMTFKMKLEIIQALSEEKASLRKPGSSQQTPVIRLLSKDNDDNNDIPIIRNRPEVKQRSNYQSTINSQKSLRSVKKVKEFDSIQCELGDNSSKSFGRLDQVEIVDKDYKRRGSMNNGIVIEDSNFQTIKEMFSLENKVDVEDDELQLISRKTISTPKEFVSIQYNIPKDEVIKLANNKKKKMVTVPKVVQLLGISIEGGINTPHPLARITKVEPNSCAGLSGEVLQGDLILEVDGIPLAGMEHKRIAQKIAEAFKNSSTDSITFLLMQTNIDLQQISDTIDYQSTYL